MTFDIARSDGRSDAEVLLDIVKNCAPGTVIDYEKIADVLSIGTDRQYDTKDVQGVVCRSEQKLAQQLSRALVNVRNRGYKVALAEDHQQIAGRKKDRAHKLLKRGLTVLKHVRWDEMDENQRRAHEGQLMIVSALTTAVDGMERRLQRVENAIKSSR